jgi:hypothetical protein
VAFIKEAQFRGVIVLTGLDVNYRPDIRKVGGLRYFATQHEQTKPFVERANALSIPQLEFILDEDDAALASQIQDLDRVPLMRGSGITRRLLLACIKEALPAFALCCFAAEGDNTELAVVMAQAVKELLSLSVVDPARYPPHGWRIPPSWTIAYRQGYTQDLFH